MKLTYSSLKDEDVFILTDFSCAPSQKILNKKGLYKILWNKNKSSKVKLDGYDLELFNNDVVFCTPLNVIEIETQSEGLIAFVFNREFFCIQTHDDQVSCHGFLFFGSSQPQTIKLSKKEVSQFSTMLNLFREDLSIKDHLQGEMLRSLLKRLLIISTRTAKKDLPQPSISNAHMNIIREYNILVEKHYSNKSNDEIARELGYKDPGHFSKFFKKHEGLSPSVFKKNKLAKD